MAEKECTDLSMVKVIDVFIVVFKPLWFQGIVQCTQS